MKRNQESSALKDIRFSLIQLLVFTGLALNIERLDFGSKENIVNLASFVYILAGLGAISTILIPNKWKLSTRNILFFWIAVYLTVKIAVSSTRPIFGGLFTYLSIVEIIVLVGSIIFSRKVIENLHGIEEIIANITMVDVSNRVKDLNDALDDIKKELVRSRRYSRPLGVIVVRFDAENIQANIDRLSEGVLRSMMSRYSMSNLIRAIDKEIRRPDLILEHHKENRIILLLPETDSRSTQAVTENIQRIAKTRIGHSVAIGSATFPDDAITFDDLVKQAESTIDGSARDILFAHQNVDELSSQNNAEPTLHKTNNMVN